VKTFRTILCLAALSLFGTLAAQADANWLTDLQKAQAEAKANHKLLLINFTGSDWCIWCKKLDAEVFNQPEFQDYAKNKLVLLTVDFPRAKPLASETRRQNQELAQKYNIEGFPTVVVLNSEGKQVGELGYQAGGASAFVNELKKIPGS